MVRTAKNRKSNKRKPRGRRIVRRRRLMFPPTIPFNRVFMNVTLRHIIATDAQAINTAKNSDWTIANIFVSPWDAMKDVFSEVRIVKVVMYATAGVGSEERGFHALNLAPKAEYATTDKTAFTVLSTLPGTKMSKIGQMLSAEWHPTSSAERNWFKVSDTTALMDYMYMSSGMEAGGKSVATYPLEIVIDSHIKLRGVSYQKMVAESERTVSLEYDFADMRTSS